MNKVREVGKYVNLQGIETPNDKPIELTDKIFQFCKIWGKPKNISAIAQPRFKISQDI